MVSRARTFPLAILFTGLIASAQAADETPSAEEFAWKKTITVQTLPYGNALFEYYRGEPFAAMTAILVAQDRGQLGPHETGAMALLGSLQLEYGMLSESEKLLTGMLAGQLPAEVRERVLVELARVRFRGGDLEGSLQRLQQLPTLSTPALNDEIALMRANIALKRNNGAEAQQALLGVNPESTQFHYALFNLGVAQLQQGQSEAAQDTFNQLLTLRAENDEQKNLRDRTHLALGYEMIRQKRPELARNQLLNVRLNSSYVNTAMLGLGWAYSQTGLHEKALTPWLNLRERQPADLPVLEAQLAVPFAYQSLEAFPDAINAYRNAMQRYEFELQQLDEAERAIEQGELLLLLPSLEEQEIPDVLQQHARANAALLKRVLAQHVFNESLKRYRDLLELREILAGWQFQLPIYQDMLANHRARYAEREPQVEAKLSTVDMAAYQQRLQRARETFEQSQQPENWLLLANDKERRLAQRIERAKTRIDRIEKARGPMPRETDKLRLMQGVLQFNVWHDSAGRQWRQEVLMTQAEQRVRELDSQRAKLIVAKDVAGSRFANFDQRIDRQLNGAQNLIVRADRLLDEEGQRLNQIALDEVRRWRAQLSDYRQQAELALARLQDRASIGAQP